MNIVLSVSLSKEIAGHKRQRNVSSTPSGIKSTISGFDRPLLYRLSYEARREEVVGDYGSNCDHVDVRVQYSVPIALRIHYGAQNLLNK